MFLENFIGNELHSQNYWLRHEIFSYIIFIKRYLCTGVPQNLITYNILIIFCAVRGYLAKLIRPFSKQKLKTSYKEINNLLKSVILYYLHTLTNKCIGVSVEICRFCVLINHKCKNNYTHYPINRPNHKHANWNVTQ